MCKSRNIRNDILHLMKRNLSSITIPSSDQHFLYVINSWLQEQCLQHSPDTRRCFINIFYQNNRSHKRWHIFSTKKLCKRNQISSHKPSRTLSGTQYNMSVCIWIPFHTSQRIKTTCPSCIITIFLRW